MKMMRRIGKGYLFHFAVIVFCFVLSSEAQVKKMNYAVIGLKNAEGVSAGEADIIADRLRVELFNTGVVGMMERDQMTSILSEQGFQQSGACTDEACMVEMGQLLGVEKLISGSIGKLGSMFLLNFRTIDVQTAKIVKVVSKDITGGIEDVVKHLPEIALQLVEGTVAEKPEVVAEPQKPEPEPEPEVTEVVESEPVVSEEPVPEKQPEVVEIGKGEDKKKKNRGGFKLGFNISPKTVKHEVELKREHWSGVIATNTSWSDWSEEFDNVEENLIINPQLMGVIKAGRFIAINVGASYARSKTRYYTEDFDSFLNNHDHELTISSHIISMLAGVNFVLRFFPIKLNFGFELDANIPITSYHAVNMDSIALWDYSSYEDLEGRGVSVDFKLLPGARIGVEVLPGTPHLGIGFDLMIRPMNYEFKNTYFSSNTDYYDTEVSDKISLSFISFGIGLTVYK